ncbi:MAG: ABC transporter permease [Alphaproteobacteria bacterium]|nr:ABC transporter permease [Alphaproteobacteria bacterium]
MQTKMQNGIDIEKDGKNRLKIVISGNILHQNIETPLGVLQTLSEADIKEVYFTANGLKDWDSSLVLWVYDTQKLCREKKVECNLKSLPQNLQDLIALAFAVDRKPSRSDGAPLSAVENIGKTALDLKQKITNALEFISAVFSGIGRCLSFSSIMRKTDFFAALEDCGPKAIGIVCLISFLIGLILAFVGAVQLQTFGAQIYVASLVTIGMCRIMGAIMVGVIMSGRTGSSYAATIGTMQVNEELDALQTMGLSRIDFLVLPRLFALLIALPILTMIADFLGMLGGAFVGVFLMDIPHQEYWKYAFNSFHLNNFLVGVFHSFCFAFIISLCGCYSGLKCGKNADSVGKATTQAVVSAIVWMIVVTGIITVICQELGI